MCYASRHSVTVACWRWSQAHEVEMLRLSWSTTARTQFPRQYTPSYKSKQFARVGRSFTLRGSSIRLQFSMSWARPSGRRGAPVCCTQAEKGSAMPQACDTCRSDADAALTTHCCETLQFLTRGCCSLMQFCGRLTMHSGLLVVF